MDHWIIEAKVSRLRERFPDRVISGLCQIALVYGQLSALRDLLALAQGGLLPPPAQQQATDMLLMFMCGISLEFNQLVTELDQAGFKAYLTTSNGKSAWEALMKFQGKPKHKKLIDLIRNVTYHVPGGRKQFQTDMINGLIKLNDASLPISVGYESNTDSRVVLHYEFGVRPLFAEWGLTAEVQREILSFVEEVHKDGAAEINAIAFDFFQTSRLDLSPDKETQMTFRRLRANYYYNLAKRK